MPTKNQLLDVIAIQRDITKIGMDLSSVMNLVTQRILSLLNTDGAAIELKESDAMVYRAASGIASTHLGLHLDVSNSLSGHCVKTGKEQFCDDTSAHPLVNKAACKKVGIQSMLVVPLKYDDKTVGVLKVMSKQPAAFAQTDLVLLNLLSEQIAAAMHFCTKLGADNLLRLASHDEMTGLVNRSVFMERLRALININKDSQTRFGIFIIDMDNLKRVNDQFGHRTGDALIVEFAERIKNALPYTTTIARLGGDEFGIVVQNIASLDELMELRHQIREHFYDDVEFEGNTLYLDASLGSACFPDEGSSLSELIELADRRMYQCKRWKKEGRLVNAIDHSFNYDVPVMHVPRK